MRSTLPRVAGITSLLVSVTSVACTKSNENATDTMQSYGSVAMSPDSLDTTATGKERTGTSPKTWTDAQIVAYAITADTGEIQLGRLAARKATDPAVKAFARQMTKDHGAMLKEARAFAARNSIMPDTAADDIADLRKKAHDALEDLSSASTTDTHEWDARYLDGQIDAHQKVLDDLQNAEKTTTNADLKEFLNKAVGKVQSHLTKAEDIKKNQVKS